MHFADLNIFLITLYLFYGVIAFKNSKNEAIYVVYLLLILIIRPSKCVHDIH